MPWKLQKSGTQYYVVDDKGKRYSDKPMSKWKAKKQLAALWASEAKESQPKSKILQYDKSKGMDTSGEKGFHVFKQTDGSYRWVTISSSAFKDKDGEIVTLRALADDIDRADTAKDYGPLRWWHVGSWEYPDGPEKWETWKAGPGADIGMCDFNMLHGNLLVESGTFKDASIGEAFAECPFPLEVSIGFSHPSNEPINKEFLNIHRFERSLLPAGMASNLVTKLYTVKGDSLMKTQEKYQALVAILRNKPDVAQKILADAESVEKAAKEQGLEFKEMEEFISGETAGETTSQETPQQPVQAAEDTNIPAVEEEASQPVLEAQEPITQEAIEPVGEIKAVTAPAVPEKPEEVDEIGDMTRKELAEFIANIYKQLAAQKEFEAAEKQAGLEQLLADTVASSKLIEARLKTVEATSAKQKQALDDLTDARPVGIKQLMDSRPTANPSNVIAEAPTGPRIDESFRQFTLGGK